MALSGRTKIAFSPARKAFPGFGAILSILLILISSLVGALVFPLSTFGRTTLASISREWLILLTISWVLFASWALLYALLFHRLTGASGRRSLYLAALGHTSLLSCLALVTALYSSDLANHVYTNTPYGQIVFQSLARTYVLVMPAFAQTLLLAIYRPRVFARILPIGLVTLVAFGLRVWNLNWELPALYHPDEHHYIGLALVMLRTGDPNPHYFENPSLLIYIDYLLARFLSPQVQAFHVTADYFNFGVFDPRGDYLIDLASRGVSAVAGTLTVVVVYLTGRDLYGRKTGAFAACLLAVSLLHVRDSHYATNDVLATFFLAVSFLFSVHVYLRGRPSNYILAALFGGLGTAAKYNVGFFAVAVLAAHLCRTCGDGSPIGRPKTHLLLIAGGVVSIAAFLLGTPYALLDFRSFLAGFAGQYGYAAGLWRGQEIQWIPIMYAVALARGFGLIPLVLAVLGGLLVLWSDSRRFIVLVAVPAAYLSFMSRQQLFFVRFAIPLLPFLALLGGYTICRLADQVRASTWRQQLSFMLLAIALIQSFTLSIWHNDLLGRDDTRTLAATWIDSHVQSTNSIAVESYAWMSSPFQWRGRQLRNTSVFRVDDPADVAEVLRGDFDYVIVSSFGYGPWQAGDEISSDVPPLYLALGRIGRLVAVFAPGIGNVDIPYDLDESYTPFSHLLERERSGPTIKVYSLRKD